MIVEGVARRTIWLAGDGRSVEIIDQTRLPHAFVVRKLTDLDAGNEDALAGNDVDEVVPLEPLQRFTDGRAPDAELAPEVVLAQHVAGCEVEVHDPTADLLVGLFAQ